MKRMKCKYLRMFCSVAQIKKAQQIWVNVFHIRTWLFAPILSLRSTQRSFHYNLIEHEHNDLFQQSLHCRENILDKSFSSKLSFQPFTIPADVGEPLTVNMKP